MSKITIIRYCLLIILFFNFVICSNISYAANLSVEDNSSTQIRKDIITELSQSKDFEIAIDNYLQNKELNIITSFEQASIRLDRYINVFTWMIGLITIIIGVATLLLVSSGLSALRRIESDYGKFKEEKNKEIEEFKMDIIRKDATKEKVEPPIFRNKLYEKVY